MSSYEFICKASCQMPTQTFFWQIYGCLFGLKSELIIPRNQGENETIISKDFFLFEEIE